MEPRVRTDILQAVASTSGEGEALLAQLVRQRSVLGAEAGALDVMEGAFATLGLMPWRVPVDAASLAGRPGWSPPLIGYAGRDNVVAKA